MLFVKIKKKKQQQKLSKYKQTAPALFIPWRSNAIKLSFIIFMQQFCWMKPNTLGTKTMYMYTDTLAFIFAHTINPKWRIMLFPMFIIFLQIIITDNKKVSYMWVYTLTPTFRKCQCSYILHVKMCLTWRYIEKIANTFLFFLLVLPLA